MKHDLIKREDVLNVLKFYGYLPLDNLYYTIEHDLPSADRPQGVWVDGADRYKRCSVCGFNEIVDGYSNYCPNCGAKMDGERKESE